MFLFPERTERRCLCQLALEDEYLRALKKKKKVKEQKRKARKGRAKQVCVASDLLLREASGAILSHFVVI